MRLLKEEQERLDEQTPGTEGIAPVITSDDLLNAGDVLLNLDGAQERGEKTPGCRHLACHPGNGPCLN